MADKDNTARYKMIFLAMLESAMRYREAYFRDEISIYAEEVKKRYDEDTKDGKKMTFSRDKKLVTACRKMILDKREGIEKFNASAYKEIETTRGQFSREIDTIFDEYSTGFGLILEQYLNAKSTKDILFVCHAYNNGGLDEFIQKYNQKENDDETKNTERPAQDLALGDLVRDDSAPDTDGQAEG